MLQEWRKTHPDECIFRVNQPYAFISSTLTFWAPVFVMLVIYRRIYKEALRQKEAIRRSSVPSQQHLIVDNDSTKSRFQELQANGFRSGNEAKKKKAKRESKRFKRKKDGGDEANGKRKPDELPGGIVIANRLSPTDSDLQTFAAAMTTKTPTITTSAASPARAPPPPPLIVPIVITSTSSSDNLQEDAEAENTTTQVQASDDGSDNETETIPLRSGECETRFGGPGNPGGGPEVTFLAPFQRISALTPAAAGFVGTIQRRLSTANSSISEGKKPFVTSRPTFFLSLFSRVSI